MSIQAYGSIMDIQEMSLVFDSARCLLVCFGCFRLSVLKFVPAIGIKGRYLSIYSACILNDLVSSMFLLNFVVLAKSFDLWGLFIFKIFSAKQS